VLVEICLINAGDGLKINAFDFQAVHFYMDIPGSINRKPFNKRFNDFGDKRGAL